MGVILREKTNARDSSYRRRIMMPPVKAKYAIDDQELAMGAD